MPKSSGVMCTVNNEDSNKHEDTMARRPHAEPLSVAAPVRETDLTASKFSPQNQPTPSCSSTNTLNGDQVFMAESTTRKVAMRQSYSLLTHSLTHSLTHGESVKICMATFAIE